MDYKSILDGPEEPERNYLPLVISVLIAALIMALFLVVVFRNLRNMLAVHEDYIFITAIYVINVLGLFIFYRMIKYKSINKFLEVLLSMLVVFLAYFLIYLIEFFLLNKESLKRTIELYLMEADILFALSFVALPIGFGILNFLKHKNYWILILMLILALIMIILVFYFFT